MSSAKTYICLDIGGTYIKHGLLTETGEILIKGKIPTRAKEGGQAVFEQAVELVEGYLEKKKNPFLSALTKDQTLKNTRNQILFGRHRWKRTFQKQMR